MLINLWVKDNCTGAVHQVGTDEHDCIEDVDGKICYTNLQNSGSTFGGEYSVVGTPELDGYISVTPEELYLNKAYCDERILEMIAKRPPKNTHEYNMYRRECVSETVRLHKKNGFIVK